MLPLPRNFWGMGDITYPPSPLRTQSQEVNVSKSFAVRARGSLDRRPCMRAGFTIRPSQRPSLPQTPEAIVKYRCDYCGGHLGLIVARYYRMRFCCKAHMSAYKQRLTMETRAKIQQLELLASTLSRYELPEVVRPTSTSK